MKDTDPEIKICEVQLSGAGSLAAFLSRVNSLMLNNVRSTVSYQRGFYKKLGFAERDASNFVKKLK